MKFSDRAPTGEPAVRGEQHRDEGCLATPAKDAASEPDTHGGTDAGDMDREPFDTAGFLGIAREAANVEAGDGLEQLVGTQVCK